MTRERLVVVGADAAGMSAASEARRTNPDLEIVAFDRGAHASYSQCGMPYWLGGVVAPRERLTARSIAAFTRRNIAVRLSHEVLAVDPERRVVRVWDAEGGRELDEPYDHLLLATGASPVEFPIPGRQLEGVFHLDVLEDAIRIDAFLERERPERVVIVGGGYVGLEMAEALTRRGLAVAVVERDEQLFPGVDFELAGPLEAELERRGVDVSLCDAIANACEGRHGQVERVHTNRGMIAADLVLLSTGVRPTTELAAAAGVRSGATGAVAVDARQATSVAGVYAAGDCAEHFHRVLGAPAWVPLGTTAHKQGRVAGRNAAGGEAVFAGIVGTAVLKVFDLGVARTGLSEREAGTAGLAVETVVLESTDQAGYMPDAEGLTVKLVVEKTTGRLLGGQAVGRRGADKRVDVLATALYAGLALAQLAQLDLAYAPPFNSAWDPLQAAATKLMRGGDP
jgi:NADPH-dependent 2,4-dienoyl-CoA reductase/sulfur reductase-like enzyme